MHLTFFEYTEYIVQQDLVKCKTVTAVLSRCHLLWVSVDSLSEI